MFAIRTRARTRRTARFVPAVDGLQPRIAPVCAVPMDVDLSDPEPEPAPTEDRKIITPRMEATWAAIDEMVLATGSEI